MKDHVYLGVSLIEHNSKVRSILSHNTSAESVSEFRGDVYKELREENPRATILCCCEPAILLDRDFNIVYQE